MGVGVEYAMEVESSTMEAELAMGVSEGTMEPMGIDVGVGDVGAGGGGMGMAMGIDDVNLELGMDIDLISDIGRSADSSATRQWAESAADAGAEVELDRSASALSSAAVGAVGVAGAAGGAKAAMVKAEAAPEGNRGVRTCQSAIPAGSFVVEVVGQVVRRDAYMQDEGISDPAAALNLLVIDPNAWMGRGFGLSGAIINGSKTAEGAVDGVAEGSTDVFDSEYLVDMRRFANIARYVRYNNAILPC
jgi:hypothetical protein